MVDGVLIGLSGVFVATASLAVTAIAALAAIVLMAVIVIAGR